MDKIPTENCTYISSVNNPLFADGAPVITDQSGISRDSTCDIGAFEVPPVGIQVLDGDKDIPDETGLVDFGSTPLNTPVNSELRVKNIGKSISLTLSGLTVPDGFAISSNFGTTIVSPGGQTTFEIDLDATQVETFSGQVSFTNNVPDRNPFSFTVSGTVFEPPIIFIPIVFKSDLGN